MGSSSRPAAGALALALLASAFALAGDEALAWPPTPEARSRMEVLQKVLIDRDSTAAERQAAREELIGLLRSPAASLAGPASTVPRASIAPLPSLAFPAASANPPLLPRIAPTLVPLPSRPNPVVDPASGRVLTPAGRAVVDPVNGRVLQETPGGYIDPLTGRVVPR